MAITTTEEAKTAFEIAKSHYGTTIDNLNNLTWGQLSDEVKGYLSANTWMDSAQVVLILLCGEALPDTDIDQAIEALGFVPREPEDDEDDGWGATLADAFAFAAEK